MRIRSLHALGAAFLLATPATAALAQNVMRERTPEPGMVFFQGDNHKTATFVATELSFDGQIVKGSPYSAEAVSESIQALADGNRIVRTSTTTVFRDAEGRTRREQSFRAFGPFPAAETGRMIFINDPVAGVNSILTPDKRVARRIPAPTVFVRKGVGAHASGGPRSDVIVLAPPDAERRQAATAEKIAVEMAAAASTGAHGEGRIAGVAAAPVYTFGSTPQIPGEAGVRFEMFTPEDAVKESLGMKAFDGVQAEGTRTTITIPAGEIGNERPIEIVTERWYSNDLHTLVYSRHSDPRFGETIYRLTNINRAEPDASLFEVPADYTIEQSTFPERFHVETKMRTQTKVVDRKPAVRRP